jgi:hypothetical protein
MPKEAEYKIMWSDTQAGYEVMHPPFSFPCKDTATLHHWLGMVSTFHFCAPTGHTLTLRKEQKQRGKGYWYAYKRVEGKILKRYLGEKSKLTLELLETVARQFVEPLPPPPPPPRKPTLHFARTLASALSIYGFTAIPDRKALVHRHRELSKQYHPDAGGLHADMVAVNLAYDYLKKFVNDRS